MILIIVSFNTLLLYYCSTSTLTEHTIAGSNSYIYFTCCDGYTDLLISLSSSYLVVVVVVPNNGDDFDFGIVVINLIL